MRKSFKSVLILSFSSTALLLAACSPQGSSKNPFTPDAPIVFNEDAAPTNVIPPPQNGIEYQQPQQILTNSDGVEIRLNQMDLTSPRIHYTSTDRKLVVTGHMALLGEDRQKVIEKNFSLSGIHSTDDSSLLLSDEIPSSDSKLQIKAIANCLSTTRSSQVSCEHVIVDIVVSYDGKYYSEQIEVDRTRPTVRTPAPTPQQRTTPPPTTAPETDEDEDADQTGLQDEDEDEALPGRYQGGLGSANLEEIFAAPAPTQPAPTQPPAATQPETPTQQPPAPTPRETPAPPSTTPTPTPTPPSTDGKTTTPEKPAPEAKPETPAPTPPPAQPTPPPATPRSRDRQVTPDTVQRPDGSVRPRNQAVGFPNRGRLQSPTSMMTRAEALQRQAYFEVAAPNMNKHFATYEMAEMIVRAGAFMNQHYTKKVYLSRVSARAGGRLPPSASHQIGNDVDLGYPTDSAHKFPLTVNNGGTHLPRNYSVEKTYYLFKYLFAQQDIKVDRIFVDQKVKNALCEFAKSKNELTGSDRTLVKQMFDNLQHVRGHRDHFHLRVKCSSHDPGCRGFNYRRIDTCS